MRIETIIANGLDLAGGNLVRHALDADAAALACLNVVDAMMLELSACGKALTQIKEEVTLRAGAQSGDVNLRYSTLDDKYIRYRTAGQTHGWHLLEVLDDIEDVTRAENENRKAICFQGLKRTSLTYHLSFVPAENIEAEIWTGRITPEIAELSSLPPFPEEFSLYCAYRLADFVLNQLLLIDDRKFASFVLAQKASINGEKARLQHIWEVYKAAPASANSVSRVREYNYRDDNERDEPELGIFF